MKDKCYYCENKAKEETIFCENCGAFPKSALQPEEIENIAEDVLNRTFKKMMENVAHDFYDSLNTYFYKHTQNYQDRVMGEALDLIIGKKWAKYKDHYDLAKLRAKIYETHKKEFDKKITEQIVENEIKRYFDLFMIDEEKTGWRYVKMEEAVVNWICNNYKKSKKLKQLIPKGLTKKVEILQRRVQSLQRHLDEIREVAGKL